ncbi:MAG: tRNA (adenosine(37)-N6)-dimethylallyltransferase MiaA [Pseudolysinimonas sp.]
MDLANGALPKLIVVLGTNASGKSALGVELARELGGEVISADSRQVFRGFDLSAGKVTPLEARGIPHHLIDIVDIVDRFSLNDWLVRAKQTIDRLDSEGKVPLVVGGTALYLDALVRGYLLTEVEPDIALRSRLESAPTSEVVSLLESLDPSAMDHIDRHNRPRLVRAIEQARAGVSYADSHRLEPSYNATLLGVTHPPDVLRSRIHERLMARIEAGMIGEVEEALADGVPIERLHQLGLEYRYLALHVMGDIPTEADLVRELEKAIYRYSRRQMSFFRRFPNVHWLDPSASLADEALSALASSDFPT